MTRPTVYQTNLAGIGVRVSLRAIGGYGGFPDRPTPSPFSQRVDNPAALPDAVWKLGYFRLTIELIKTGPAATPGELEYRSERFLMAEHTPLAALDLTGRISTAGCSVNDATPALIKLLRRCLTTSAASAKPPATPLSRCSWIATARSRFPCELTARSPLRPGAWRSAQ